MRLLRAELLKLVTTRLLLWLGLLLLALEVLVISLHVSQDSVSSLAEPRNQRDVIGIAAVAALVALIVGVVSSAGEYGHGTISHTFLVAPVRERVVVAKVLAGALAGVALAAFAGVVAWVLAALLLSVRSVPVHLGSADVMRALCAPPAPARGPAAPRPGGGRAAGRSWPRPSPVASASASGFSCGGRRPRSSSYSSGCSSWNRCSRSRT